MLKPLMRKLAVAGVVAATAGASPAALADWTTLYIHWSGAAYQNAYTADAVFMFDSSYFSNDGQLYLTPDSPLLGQLSMVVNGATATTFGADQFASVSLEVPYALDMGQELIGQVMSNGATFGTPDGNGGDFAMRGRDPASGIPAYGGPFTIFSGDTAGAQMQVTSITAVPEPEAYALLVAGLGLLAMQRRKSA